MVRGAGDGSETGRPIFAEVIRLLHAGEAKGVIVHKVDRSARNLWDWAKLGNLIDEGIDVPEKESNSPTYQPVDGKHVERQL